MITRVEISGFKTFTDFSVDLAPLTVIAGANASGKTNFLDALQVIQGLARGQTLNQSISNRGSAKDFYTKYNAHHCSNTTRMGVKIFVPAVFDDGRKSHSLDGTRFRYELSINNYLPTAIPHPIVFEKLSFIDPKEDKWGKDFVPEDRKNSVLRYPAEKRKPLLLREREEQFSPFKIPQEVSALGEVKSDSDIHLQAVLQSLLHINYCQLFHADNFSNFHNRKENESIILNELKDLALHHREDLNKLSMRVSQIAKSIKRINVEVDDFDRLSLIAEDRNGARYLSDSLSEGTLRTIALATFLFSKKPQQTILLEEPENGIDPRVLRQVVELLSDLATDFSSEGLPHVQVICTTHSPALLEMMIEHPEANHITTYLATMINKAIRIGEETFTTSATRIQPIVEEITTPIEESRAERMTLHQAKAYMKYGRLNSPSDI